MYMNRYSQSVRSYISGHEHVRILEQRRVILWIVGVAQKSQHRHAVYDWQKGRDNERVSKGRSDSISNESTDSFATAHRHAARHQHLYRIEHGVKSHHWLLFLLRAYSVSRTFASARMARRPRCEGFIVVARSQAPQIEVHDDDCFFITINSGLVPLIEGLCAQISELVFEIIGALCSDLLLFRFGRKNMLKEKSTWSKISSRLLACTYTCVLCTHIRIYV